MNDILIKTAFTGDVKNEQKFLCLIFPPYLFAKLKFLKHFFIDRT